jgi:hypothetical protein
VGRIEECDGELAPPGASFRGIRRRCESLQPSVAISRWSSSVVGSLLLRGLIITSNGVRRRKTIEEGEECPSLFTLHSSPFTPSPFTTLSQLRFSCGCVGWAGLAALRAAPPSELSFILMS